MQYYYHRLQFRHVEISNHFVEEIDKTNESVDSQETIVDEIAKMRDEVALEGSAHDIWRFARYKRRANIHDLAVVDARVRVETMYVPSVHEPLLAFVQVREVVD